LISGPSLLSLSCCINEALAGKQEERSFFFFFFSFFLSFFLSSLLFARVRSDYWISLARYEDLSFPFFFFIIIYTYLFLIGVISIGSLFQRGTNVS